MIIHNFKFLFFKYKIIFFTDHLFDVPDTDVLIFCYCKNLLDGKDFRKEEKLTSIIDLTQDLDVIWGKFNSKVRQKIRRAQDYGIKTKYNVNYEEFYKLNKDFSKKKGFSFWGYDIPSPEFMKKNGLLITAECNGNLISGAFYYLNDTNIICWIMASVRLDVEKELVKKCSYANHLITWEAIKYAKSRGIKEWDWGGLWSEEQVKINSSKEGLRRFKLNFGGDEVIRYNYERRYSKVFQYALFLNKNFRYNHHLM